MPDLREKDIQSFIMMWKRGRGLIVPNIYLKYGEADILFVTNAGIATEFEIKTSLRDFKNDKKKTVKHGMYEHAFEKKAVKPEELIPNYFVYVFPSDVEIPKEDMPKYSGAFKVTDKAGLGYYNFFSFKKSVHIHKTKCNWDKLIARSCAFRMAEIHLKNFYKTKEVGMCNA